MLHVLLTKLPCQLVVGSLILLIFRFQIQNKLTKNRWSASSCCFNQFSGQIDADGLRGLRQSLNRIAGNFRNPNCYYAVADLSCILCSPDTALWLELNLPGPPNVKVCRQTCDTGYLECQKDLDVLNTNSSIVFDGKTFCNHILQPLGMNPSIVQARDPSPCFFGVARYSQIEASENICLDAPPKSSASWLSPSISFWLLLFIIAVKVTHMSLQ